MGAVATVALIAYAVGVPVVYGRLAGFACTVEERRDVLHIALAWPLVLAIHLFDEAGEE